MDGKVCLVTGANSGVGLETVKGLAHRGATVVMVSRDPRKGEDARAAVARQTGSEHVELLIADLASLDAVRNLAMEFRARHDRLDVLVNNAGVVLNRRQVTPDGYEQTFQVNHLAPFLLTSLLLDVLRAGAPARVITVSSDAHRGGRVDFEDLQSQRSYSGRRAYSTTKLQNVLFTKELAERLKGSGVTANAVHPGFVRTNFGHNNPGPLRRIIGLLQRVAAISPERGAQTTLYVATAPELAGVTGRYFESSAVRTPSAAAQEAAAARRLWEESERLTGLRTG